MFSQKGLTHKPFAKMEVWEWIGIKSHSSPYSATVSVTLNKLHIFNRPSVVSLPIIYEVPKTPFT